MPQGFSCPRRCLAHFGERLKIVYDDPDGHDKLYRFMESIQEFFDLSSKLEVSFN